MNKNKVSPFNWSRMDIAREKIQYYRQASDDEVMRCLTDNPQCAFAGLHQMIDIPYAKREAKRRGLIK